MCMVEVKNGNLDAAMKILKRKMDREGIMQELKSRESFSKPSVRKREKHLAAVRRQKKHGDKTPLFDKKEWYEMKSLNRPADAPEPKPYSPGARPYTPGARPTGPKPWQSGNKEGGFKGNRNNYNRDTRPMPPRPATTR